MIRFPILHVLAILSLLIGANFGLSAGNPYSFAGVVPPDQETYPPIITITSPVNNTAYNTSRVPLTFNVTAPQSRTASYVTVDRVTYEVDWRKEPISVLNGPHQQPSLNLWLSNISEGQHTILISARGMGQITNEKELSYKWFFISSSVTICFTIDRTPPTVSFLPPENVSSTSAVPLNLIINESYSKIAYSLNGQQNVTVTRNSTISHLAAGQYNVTFHAWDVAGNVGSSETMNFSVSETPKTIEEVNDPLLLPAAAVTSMIVVFGISLLLYKRHRRVETTNRN